MRARAAVVLLSALLMIVSVPAQDARAADGPVMVAAAQGHPRDLPAPSQAEIEMQKRMIAQRNQERFAKIKKDSDQLLELATQLKKSVDQASDQTLSVDVIRNAEKIEKLAKQVRQKMVGE
jgi:hypothetical protein